MRAIIINYQDKKSNDQWSSWICNIIIHEYDKLYTLWTSKNNIYQNTGWYNADKTLAKQLSRVIFT